METSKQFVFLSAYVHRKAWIIIFAITLAKNAIYYIQAILPKFP